MTVEHAQCLFSYLSIHALSMLSSFSLIGKRINMVHTQASIGEHRKKYFKAGFTGEPLLMGGAPLGVKS